MTREVRWPHGRAWIGPTPADWPKQMWEPPAPPVERGFAAGDAGAPRAVLVRYANQTGGDFLAILGGVFAPVGVDRLAVRAAVEPAVAEAVFEGIESVPAGERPAGELDLGWFVVHLVDSRAFAWRRAAAMLVRLLRAELPDGDAAIRALWDMTA